MRETKDVRLDGPGGKQRRMGCCGGANGRGLGRVVVELRRYSWCERGLLIVVIVVCKHGSDRLSSKYGGMTE